MSSTSPEIEPTQRSSAGTQLLDRAFALLGLFSDDAPEWTITEMAHASDLPVPTVHRILTALERHRYLIRDESTKRFRLGPAALELGRLARATIDLRSVCRPILQRLAVESGETAVLTTLSRDRSKSICLERVESSHDLRLSVEPGRQMPLHAGASQKALLAHMKDHEIQAVLDQGLDELCRATITEPGALLDELSQIRRNGWATSYEETNLGVWGIAMTLVDNNEEVVAAIGLAGPRIRIPKARVGNVLATLDQGASDLAGTLAIRTSRQVANERRNREEAETTALVERAG